MTSGNMNMNLPYLSPYLTCEDCNSIVFIDSNHLRTCLSSIRGNSVTKHVKLASTNDDIDMQSHHYHHPESVPACPTCKKTLAFRLGADDLSYLQKESYNDLMKRNKKQKREIVKLQRAYRKYLQMKFTKAKLQYMLIEGMLKTRCACVIQSMFRMRMAIRRLLTEKFLSVILYSRPMLMARALDTNIHKDVRVFWYKSQDELQILYHDYYALVERLGYDPSLFEVEKNIAVIAKRIQDREFELVTRLQSKWRGIVVRRYNQVFQREVRYVRERMVESAMRIQVVFRGVLGRKAAKRYQFKCWKETTKLQYEQTLSLERKRKSDLEAKARLKQQYVKFTRERKILRYLKKLPWEPNQKAISLLSSVEHVKPTHIEDNENKQSASKSKSFGNKIKDQNMMKGA